MALSALYELYRALADKPDQEKITPEERSVIASCHRKVFWTAGFASGLAGGLGWQVAKRVKKLRISLTVLPAVAAFSVAWDWSNSTIAVSCLDDILRQDATRMQRELANVLVKYNRGEAWRWQLMSKHFYPEAVYNDQGEKPQMRWRKRRTFTEIAASYDDDDVDEAIPIPQRTNNGLSRPRHRSISHGSDASKTKPVLQNSSGNSDGEMVDEDALDIVFGGPEPTESVPAPVNTKTSSKAQTRKQKRAQRRQRRKNREEASINNTSRYEYA